MYKTAVLLLDLLLIFLPACRKSASQTGFQGELPRWFALDSLSASPALRIRSPYDGSETVCRFSQPARRIICMSTTYAACLTAIGAGESVVGLSAATLISDELLRSRYASGQIVEVGYDAAFDYEAALAAQADVVVAYSLSATPPRYVQRLRELGVPCLVLYDHLENHPLARAAYLRLFGVLTGHQAEADSLYAEVAERYHSLCRMRGNQPAFKALVNIPYGGLWYVPGGDNYLSVLIRDAGGVVLGAEDGQSESSVMDLERAYALSKEADIWLHPGSCPSLAALRRQHPLFSEFPVIEKAVYNNTRRLNPQGGNDFWESGAVHPDRILEDLLHIAAGETDSLYYYTKIE